jgi:hypothetical protein
MNISHVGALHKSTLFKRYGKFNTEYTSAGDYEYFMRCGETLQSLFLDKVTASMVAGGVSNNYSSILETYRIQFLYGIRLHIIFYRACTAIVKRTLRKYIRGY